MNTDGNLNILTLQVSFKEYYYRLRKTIEIFIQKQLHFHTLFKTKLDTAHKLVKKPIYWFYFNESNVMSL